MRRKLCNFKILDVMLPFSINDGLYMAQGRWRPVEDVGNDTQERPGASSVARVFEERQGKNFERARTGPSCPKRSQFN